jgi:carbonic anhydrase/acetyltransferase-like protein (isoleucine patch superfamily)
LHLSCPHSEGFGGSAVVGRAAPLNVTSKTRHARFSSASPGYTWSASWRGDRRQGGMGVMDVSPDEYPVPPRVVGRGAVFVEHRLKTPQVSESAYVAPTAVLAGDVTVGTHSRVLFGAVITAEGGPVEIGNNCVIMENAVIRGVPNQETRLGDDVLVGPHAHLTGCVIEGRSRIATGAVVFNGARVETGAEVEFNAVVYVNTVVPSGTGVPMGWFAGGQPAELVAPGDWDRIRAIMGPLDYPGTVFGIGASDTGSLMSGIARRYARGLALHHRDHIVPDQRHLPASDDQQP